MDIENFNINTDEEALSQWLNKWVRCGMEYETFLTAISMYAMKRGGTKGTNIISYIDGWYRVKTPNGNRKFDNPREAIEYLFEEL